MNTMPIEREGSREKRVISLLVAILAIACACIFAVSIKALAYAEPGGFPAFYGAAKLARNNLSQLYNLQFQNIYHPDNRGTGYFFHLPYEVALLIPLSYMPQVQAFVAWSLFNLGCLWGSAKILQRQFPDFGIFVPLAFAPTLWLLVNGQDTAIVVLATAIAFDQFVRGRELSAGAMLALGMFKYPFVVPLVAILCFRHRRVLLGFITGSIPLLAISAAMVGMQGIRQYVAMTRVTDARESPFILCNLRGLVGVISSGNHPAWCIGLSVALVAYAASLKVPRVAMFCMAVIVTQLVSWHGHLYDAVLLLIPMAWMLESERGWVRWSAVFLLVATPFLIVFPFQVYLLTAVMGAQLMLLVPHTRRNILSGSAVSPESER